MLHLGGYALVHEFINHYEDKLLPQVELEGYLQHLRQNDSPIHHLCALTYSLEEEFNYAKGFKNDLVSPEGEKGKCQAIEQHEAGSSYC